MPECIAAVSFSRAPYCCTGEEHTDIRAGLLGKLFGFKKKKTTIVHITKYVVLDGGSMYCEIMPCNMSVMI